MSSGAAPPYTNSTWYSFAASESSGGQSAGSGPGIIAPPGPAGAHALSVVAWIALCTWGLASKLPHPASVVGNASELASCAKSRPATLARTCAPGWIVVTDIHRAPAGAGVTVGVGEGLGEGLGVGEGDAFAAFAATATTAPPATKPATTPRRIFVDPVM
ncbi:MAG: hypothetical protein ACRDNM_00165 [Gaiellaceae bacterium]